MMPSLQSLLHLKRSKSKTPELGRSATNPVTNGHILQQTHAWPYSPQAQIQHQPPIQHQCQHMSHQQVYPQPQQPIPWPQHYTSQHIIQSAPQQQSIQPYSIQPTPLQSQIKPQSNLLESRPTDNGMVMNGHVAHQPPHFTALPAFPSSQVQSMTITGQSQRYSTDNPYYSNQIVTLALQQQQQQQQQHHHHQQHQPHQQNQQQLHQHHNHNHNHQHQQQMLLQQQQQIHQSSHQQRMVMDEPQKSRPQFQHQQHQVQPATNQLGSIDAQRQEQIQQQQQYQNHPIVNDHTIANGNEELSLDVLWMMHESDRQKLSKLAESMEKDLKALNEELDIIRRETPTYSVSEAKI